MATERKVKYNYWKGKYLSVKNNTSNKNKIVHASELFDSDEEIAQKYDNESLPSKSATTLGDEIAIDAIRDMGATHDCYKQYFIK